MILKFTRSVSVINRDLGEERTSVKWFYDSLSSSTVKICKFKERDDTLPVYSYMLQAVSFRCFKCISGFFKNVVGKSELDF